MVCANSLIIATRLPTIWLVEIIGRVHLPDEAHLQGLLKFR